MYRAMGGGGHRRVYHRITLNKPAADPGWKLGLTLLVLIDKGGGAGGIGGVHTEKAEYGHSVYCNTADSGHL